MKRLTTTGVDNQIAKLDDAASRTRKILAEFTELSRRDWKGGDMPIASQNRNVVNELQRAVDAMAGSRNELQCLSSIIKRKLK